MKIVPEMIQFYDKNFYHECRQTESIILTLASYYQAHRALIMNLQLNQLNI